MQKTNHSLKKTYCRLSSCIFVIILTVIFINTTFATEQKPSLKTAYFTVWDENALVNNSALKLLSEELSKPQNGNYVINTIPCPRHLNSNNSISIVAWKYFKIPKSPIKNHSYLWQLESPISISVPPTELYKESFKKIFTYYKPSCDDKKIIHLPIPYNYDQIISDYDIQKKEILVTHVGQYSINHHYIQRIKTIYWFLENHPDDILFYGNGWNEILPNLSKNAKQSFSKKYGGYIPDKIKTISRAKFVLAFENTRAEDYVSEKIYDAMAAGSVPIYSGAPNIDKHVPKECYIDFHAFKKHDDLYKYISTMPDEKYMSYLNCIRTFMSEPEKHANHPKNVVSIILSHIDEK